MDPGVPRAVPSQTMAYCSERATSRPVNKASNPSKTAAASPPTRPQQLRTHAARGELGSPAAINQDITHYDTVAASQTAG